MKPIYIALFAMLLVSCEKQQLNPPTLVDNERQLTYDPANGLWFGADFWTLDADSDTIMFMAPAMVNWPPTVQERCHIDLNLFIQGALYGDVVYWEIVRDYMILIKPYYVEEDSLFSEKVPLWDTLINKIGLQGNDPQLYARCCIDTNGFPCDLLVPAMCDSCVAVCEL